MLAAAMDTSDDPWAAEPCEAVARSALAGASDAGNVATQQPAAIPRPVFVISDGGMGLLGWSS
eukprot:3888103-Lingulodinium_polyedra.AAC.1